MASAEPKKRKFKYPGMIMSETDSSSNDSTMHSDHNNLPPQKKPKFSHPDRLMEDSSLSDNSLSDQENQIAGEESPPRPSSPIAGPSNQPNEPDQSNSPIPGPSRIEQPSTSTDANWFEEETKVFENDDFILVIQKQDHQRQKVFRLEDHLFVMRIKLKNHKKPPLLSSIRDIIDQTMTVMVNDLKNHYNPQESNLIYVTIKQPGDSCKYNCELLI